MTWLLILKFPHFGLQIYILKISWFSVYKNCGSDGLGAERKCEADILSWTRVLQVFRSSLQCLSDGDKCLFVSAKLWIFWILVTKCLVNGDQYLEKSWQLSGVIPELFFIRNVTGEELGLRNGVWSSQQLAHFTSRAKTLQSPPFCLS